MGILNTELPLWNHRYNISPVSPNAILLYSYRSWGLAQPSSEKLLPEAHGHNYRGSEADISQKWETLEHSALNGMSPSKPSPQASGNPIEEEGRV